MNNEISTLESNHTWVLTTLPQNKHPIGSKWVFRIKYNANGSVDKYKARLVRKGYTQQEGINYTKTFAPVAKMVTVRRILVISSINNWPVQQLDINNTFLHGDLNKEVYMRWYIKLTTFLVSLGLTSSHADPSLFAYYKGSDSLILLIYVDDFLLTSNNSVLISKIKDQLHYTFSIKDLGALHCYLGIEFSEELKWNSHDTKEVNFWFWNFSGQYSHFLALKETANLKVFVPTLVRILYDNISTIALASNPVQHARTKHIELDCHFVRDKIKGGQIQISCVPTKSQAADIFTKALTTYLYRQCLSKLGMCDPYTLTACEVREGIMVYTTKSTQKSTLSSNAEYQKQRKNKACGIEFIFLHTAASIKVSVNRCSIVNSLQY
ncbi:retrovirus-related pol polyprotein from transposon TNT 1-94 [Tanacetum coccineum]